MRWLRRLQPGEGLLVLGFLASAGVSVYANVDLASRGVSSRRIEGGLVRLGAVLVLGAVVAWIERWLRRAAPGSRGHGVAEFFRTILPFAMCIAVYTNLHDTVRFVNPHDIHHYLNAAEGWLFGGQPVVWAERYITPARTEFFTLFYANFYLVAPSVVLLLWFTGKRAEARHVLLGTILCFYTGYVLYVLFPAAPPRLYLESLGMFSVTLRGGPIANFQQALFEMMPNQAARAAFPSLHSAVSLLSLAYAWRYCRWYFPILFVFVVGLLVSTVYLRHHWVVDLIAGALLVPWVLWLTPRFEGWWRRRVQASSPGPDPR
ncbi:MAG: phosphatase PAP2 family protein [Vicinamibacterales bacterium]